MHDLVVCIHFINWIPLEDVRKAIANMTVCGSPIMIVGTSMVPEDAGALRRASYGLAFAHINRRSRDGRPQYVHKEGDVLSVFSETGLNVKEREFIIRRRTRENYPYLLERC